MLRIITKNINLINAFPEFDHDTNKGTLNLSSRIKGNQ